LIDSSAPAHLPRSLVCECEGNILLGGWRKRNGDSEIYLGRLRVGTRVR
jgi:hypothetical protein